MIVRELELSKKAAAPFRNELSGQDLKDIRINDDIYKLRGRTKQRDYLERNAMLPHLKLNMLTNAQQRQLNQCKGYNKLIQGTRFTEVQGCVAESSSDIHVHLE